MFNNYCAQRDNIPQEQTITKKHHKNQPVNIHGQRNQQQTDTN